MNFRQFWSRPSKIPQDKELIHSHLAKSFSTMAILNSLAFTRPPNYFVNDKRHAWEQRSKNLVART